MPLPDLDEHLDLAARVRDGAREAPSAGEVRPPKISGPLPVLREDKGGIALAKQASSVPAISGTWVFHTTETGECGHTYDGWTVPVWQKGKTFYGNEVPQPVITNGKLSGNTVTFSIIVYPEYDMGDGNFTDLEGTLEGNLITGTLSGHNGGNSCFWEGDFTVTIQD